jgi:predicted RNase H-like HicB family nuclease
MKKFLMIVEENGRGFSAFSPDIVGCVATGNSRDEVEKAMLDAVKIHIEQLKKEGYNIPEPKSYSKIIEVAD